MFFKALIKLCVVTSILLISGCATVSTFKAYEGEEKSNDQVARITSNVKREGFAYQRLSITKIDEISTFDFAASLLSSPAYPTSAIVLPGRHYIGLKYEHGLMFSDSVLWFDAEAGASYLLNANVDGYGVKFWITDASTGRAVGGIPGGEPKKEKDNKLDD